MRAIDVAGFAVFLFLLVALGYPIGRYMAAVYTGEARRAQRLLGWLERLILRAIGRASDGEQNWKEYASALLLFSAAGLVVAYALQRLQGVLPLNPTAMGAVPPEVAFNTAVSFVTNTNWQAYGGESTMSHLTQMLALTTQNFVSTASGMAVLVALIRGLVGKQTDKLGNFWVDLVRSTVYILLPLSFVMALALVADGVTQTLDGTITAGTQSLIVGPVASQEAIKQIGTNGGGFFNANSAHPFENPTPFTNLLEVLAILLLPTALCFTFGRMVKDERQGWTLLAAKLVIFVPLVIACTMAEAKENPRLAALGVHGASLEGKELRFGVFGSALWAAATTAASSGSVNSMHDSFSPLGGLVPMWLMQLGEIVFGGVGSGLYGLLVYALLAVFIAGLMVGRTPEYLGKKVEAFDIKMAALVVVVPAAVVLLGTALAVLVPSGAGAVANPGPHGFSEILYAFSSGANNNGSAFGGLTVNGHFYTVAIAVAMWMGRFWVMVPILALAGSLAKKKKVPPSSGTLPTHTLLFLVLLVGTILLVGSLTFVPALALGPVVEHFQLFGAP